MGIRLYDHRVMERNELFVVKQKNGGSPLVACLEYRKRLDSSSSSSRTKQVTIKSYDRANSCHLSAIYHWVPKNGSYTGTYGKVIVSTLDASFYEPKMQIREWTMDFSRLAEYHSIVILLSSRSRNWFVCACRHSLFFSIFKNDSCGKGMSYDIARKEDFWEPFLKWTNAIENVSFFLLTAPAGWSAVSRDITFQRERVTLYDTTWRRGHSDNQRRRVHSIYDYWFLVVPWMIRCYVPNGSLFQEWQLRFMWRGSVAFWDSIVIARSTSHHEEEKIIYCMIFFTPTESKIQKLKYKIKHRVVKQLSSARIISFLSKSEPQFGVSAYVVRTFRWEYHTYLPTSYRDLLVI